MKDSSIKSMVFYFLERINYNQTWDEIENDLSYDLGDFNFGFKKEITEKVKRLAKQNWIELQGYFNAEGN